MVDESPRLISNRRLTLHEWLFDRKNWIGAGEFDTDTETLPSGWKRIWCRKAVLHKVTGELRWKGKPRWKLYTPSGGYQASGGW